MNQGNATSLPEGPDRSGAMLGAFLVKKIKVKGFIIFDDFPNHYTEFAKEMTGWIQAGKIKYRKQIVEGLESAPDAFNEMLEGRNFGKVVIKVGRS
jgi:NADPH-dependent curcumin reductase